MVMMTSTMMPMPFLVLVFVSVALVLFPRLLRWWCRRSKFTAKQMQTRRMLLRRRRSRVVIVVGVVSVRQRRTRSCSSSSAKHHRGRSFCRRCRERVRVRSCRCGETFCFFVSQTALWLSNGFSKILVKVHTIKNIQRACTNTNNNNDTITTRWRRERRKKRVFS